MTSAAGATAAIADREIEPEGERVMLKTGKEHLESLRDGRIVYIGNERVDDVTTHPAFRHGAQTVAGIYDMKADPANREP